MDVLDEMMTAVFAAQFARAFARGRESGAHFRRIDQRLDGAQTFLPFCKIFAGDRPVFATAAAPVFARAGDRLERAREFFAKLFVVTSANTAGGRALRAASRERTIFVWIGGFACTTGGVRIVAGRRARAGLSRRFAAGPARRIATRIFAGWRTLTLRELRAG